MRGIFRCFRFKSNYMAYPFSLYTFFSVYDPTPIVTRGVEDFKVRSIGL